SLAPPGQPKPVAVGKAPDDKAIDSSWPVVRAGWQRGETADESSSPAQAPAIEIPAPPASPRSQEPELTAPPELKKSKDDKSTSQSPPRSLAPSLEPPPEIPLKNTERVSQWRPMVRHNDTAAIPLVPSGMDNASTPSANVAAKRSWGVISAVAQEK